MIIEFGRRLTELRESRHLSQQQLATRLGLSRSMISHYEFGDRHPSLDSLVAIARLFGVSTDYLLGVNNATFSFGEKTLDVSGLPAEYIDALSSLADQYRMAMIVQDKNKREE